MTRCGILAAALLAATLCGQTKDPPLSKDEVIRYLAVLRVAAPKDLANTEKQIGERIRSRRLSFPAPKETLEELRKDGASAAVLSALTDAQLTAQDVFPPQSAAARITKDILLGVANTVGQQKTPGERSYLDQEVIAYLRGKRTDFAVTAAVEQELTRAGASAALIAAVKQIQLTPAELLEAAQADLQAGRVTQAISEADTAASMRPSVEVFNLLSAAKAQANDTAGSQAASLKALGAGGEVTIAVALAPLGENFRKTCDAKLTIGRGRVTLLLLPPPATARPECAASEIHAAALVSYGPNDYVGKDRQAYHVLVQPAQGNLMNLSLAPASGGNKWALDVLAAASK